MPRPGLITAGEHARAPYRESRRYRVARGERHGREASSPSKQAKGAVPESGVAACMGFVEAWVREKPIRTFMTRLAQRRAEAAAAAADGDASIPQLSSIANSVVSRCSRYAAPRATNSTLLRVVGIESLFRVVDFSSVKLYDFGFHFCSFGVIQQRSHWTT
jgi:hypothetical protein